jgi:hypothetical protein
MVSPGKLGNASLILGHWGMCYLLFQYNGQGQFLVLDGQTGAVILLQAPGTMSQQDPAICHTLFC